MLLALPIFIATLILVIWQPRGLGIGWSASAGALIALLTGVIHPADIPAVWSIVWNATFTFIAIIITSLLLDEAGFFEWAALHIGRWGNGRGRRLFVLVVLLGAVVAAVFANDGAALILTPIVFEMLVALGFSAGATLAFVMAAGFIADTASLPLVISNLVNIVSADYFDIAFGEYAGVMVLVDIVSVLASLGMLYLFFRRAVPSTYALGDLRKPREAIRDPAVFKAGWWVLGLLLVGFFVAEPLGVPVCVIAAIGASILFVIAQRGHHIHTRGAARRPPEHRGVFAGHVPGGVWLRNAGLTDMIAGGLNGWAGMAPGSPRWGQASSPPGFPR